MPPPLSSPPSLLSRSRSTSMQRTASSSPRTRPPAPQRSPALQLGSERWGARGFPQCVRATSSVVLSCVTSRVYDHDDASVNRVAAAVRHAAHAPLSSPPSRARRPCLHANNSPLQFLFDRRVNARAADSGTPRRRAAARERAGLSSRVGTRRRTPHTCVVPKTNRCSWWSRRCEALWVVPRPAPLRG